MVYFENENIKIRSIFEEDIIYLFSWWIDKEVYGNDPKPMPCNSKELLKECKSYCEIFESKIINSSKYEYFIIVNRKDYPIGFVNFFDIDKEKGDGELGVIIGDKRYWNKGIASLAISKVREILFNRQGINRIHIYTAEDNLVARKLFKKLGFNECGECLDEGFKFKVAATFGVSFATASRVAAVIFAGTSASVLKASLLATVGFIGAGIAVMVIGLGLAWLISRYNTRYKMSVW